MFTKIKNTRQVLRRASHIRVMAAAMVLALGITTVTTFAAPAKTHAYVHPNYSVINCAQERRPLLSLSSNINHGCVKALQTFYKYFKGYAVNPHDGIFGTQTAFFTVVYQRNKLIQDDGAVGTQTWNQIMFDCLNAQITYHDAYKTLVCNMTN